MMIVMIMMVMIRERIERILLVSVRVWGHGTGNNTIEMIVRVVITSSQC